MTFLENQKKVAVLQSNYIPWKGYFDLINVVDEFILYDDMQYTKNDWRNRNKIKTQSGAQWLTIPVRKHSLSQKIKETEVANHLWRKKHWNSIVTNYSKAKFFKKYENVFEELYLGGEEERLSVINYNFIEAINKILGIKTLLSWSSDYELLETEDKMKRLVHLCIQTGAEEYYSGPAAKGYLDEEMFKKEGIGVSWINYSGYPEYNQLFGSFENNVSIIDLILNEGPDAIKHMKSF